ncbi:hypothetical protein SAMN05428969_2009 [Devosia sp. YR412]|uniref:type IV toxin-antitoxin system AbiEi family antitoxin domain-containing protein n=1 Tax=Devosia sp. YR412 TaxID=1881030 RepID=UPI0008C40DFD|nr:type IV toxin-antitoxin system AbiEi family antitoxin [Devosia sp. YR412]SEQ10863.1 hypothetical protein SAMN05428969_2009 [Devosia sp. YR412]
MSERFNQRLRALRSGGCLTFTLAEAQNLFGMTSSAFADASQMAIRRQALFKPRQGLYVIPSHRDGPLRAPPMQDIIDDIMTHDRAPYYVGLLSAAKAHGARVPAGTPFQVVSSKILRSFRLSAQHVEFFHRKNMPPLDMLQRRRGDVAQLRLSSALLTAVDLLRYRRHMASHDLVRTMLGEMAGCMDVAEVPLLLGFTPVSVLQRLGYFLDLAGAKQLADTIAERIDGASRPTGLGPVGHTSKAKPALERRWQLFSQ